MLAAVTFGRILAQIRNLRKLYVRLAPAQIFQPGHSRRQWNDDFERKSSPLPHQGVETRCQVTGVGRSRGVAGDGDHNREGGLAGGTQVVTLSPEQKAKQV